MVQTDQDSWVAGTGDGRKVARGPALGTLPLVILEVIVFCLLRMRHALKVWENNKLIVTLLYLSVKSSKHNLCIENDNCRTSFFTLSLSSCSSLIMRTMSLWTAEARTTLSASAFRAMLHTISSWENTLYRCSRR